MAIGYFSRSQPRRYAIAMTKKSMVSAK